MSISKYGYINAKIGGMKSYLLKANEIRSMTEVKNYEDFLSLLRGTPYGKELSKLSSTNPIDVENTLYKSLFNDYHKITRHLPESTRGLVENLEKKFEVSTLKAIIEMKAAGFSEKEIKSHPWFLTKVITGALLEKLISLEKIEELVENLQSTEYYKTLAAAIPKYQETRMVTPFMIALDKYVYSEMGRALDKLSGLDKDKAKILIGTEIDSKNLLLAIRLRGMPDEDVWNSFIPYRFKLRDEMIRGILRTRNLTQLTTDLPTFSYSLMISSALREYEKTMETLPYDMVYLPPAAETLEGFEKPSSFLPLELLVRKFINSLAKKAFWGYRFHIGVPLAYLYLKENEIRNLVAILKAKEVGLSSTEFEGLIIY